MNKKILILMIILGLAVAFVVFGKLSSNKSMIGEVNNEMKEEMKEEMKDEMEIVNEGTMAAEFSLKDLDGNLHSLSDYKGEKVYLKFWASWCPICLSGLEELDKLSAEDLDFKVITIVSPSSNGEMKSEEFIEWYKSLKLKILPYYLMKKVKLQGIIWVGPIPHLFTWFRKCLNKSLAGSFEI